MSLETHGEPAATANRTTVERKSGRELVITRSFDGAASLVFAAWTTPDLLKRWWAPRSSGMSLVSCPVDARTGGSYRFEFGHPAAPQPIAFFGRYIEVIPNARLVWTNEESDAGAITTVTLRESGGRTHLTLHEIYPSDDALDEAIQGMEGGMPEQFAQLDDLLATLDAGKAAS